MNNDQTSRQAVHLVASVLENNGFAFRDLPTSDYGIDAEIELRGPERGTGRLIALQIKGGPSYFAEQSATSTTYRPSPDHVTYWLGHSLPVVLMLADIDDREVFWELVSSETLIPAGNRLKIDVPFSQRADSATAAQIASYCVPYAAASSFSIASERDVSNAKARRVSQEVLVHPTAQGTTKATAASIIRQSVTEGIGSDYRTNLTTSWKDLQRPVHMVSGFVYLREVDRSTASWCARYQWISEAIDIGARYTAFEGETIAPNTRVEWRLNNDMSQSLDSSRAKKGAYLAAIEKPIGLLQRVCEKRENQQAGNEPTSFLEEQIEAARIVKDALDARPMPPPECARLDQSVSCLEVLLGNFCIVTDGDGPYSPKEVGSFFRPLSKRSLCSSTRSAF